MVLVFVCIKKTTDAGVLVIKGWRQHDSTSNNDNDILKIDVYIAYLKKKKRIA